MQVIYKYPVESGMYTVIDVPKGSEVAHFGTDPQGVLCVWVVRPDDVIESVERTFYVAATGQRFVNNRKFVATAKQGMFMWHLLEVVDNTLAPL